MMATQASRRRVLKGAFAVAGSALVRAGTAQPAAEPRVIEMTAHRFSYEPNEISLRAGERVVVAIRSLDFVHGMKASNVRVSPRAFALPLSK